MIHHRFALSLALLGFLIWGATASHAADNLAAGRLAVHGYDPVAYFDGTPTKGQASLSAKSAGAVYHFANEANRAKFEADPAKYTPAYGGWCAWAMLDGEEVDIDPMTFKIADGKLLLFYNGFWGNTLPKWNEKANAEGEDTLLSQAGAHWKKLQ